MVLDIEGFRKAGYEAVDKICEYYQNLEKRPVNAQVEPGFLSKSIPDHAPEKGEDWGVISKDYQDVILPGITHWQHPNFFAYYPCNATFEGALADLHCAMISNPAFNWSCSPSVTELEIIQLDWLAKALGLSQAFQSPSSANTNHKDGGGIILGSASEVALTVAIAAREKTLAYLNDIEEKNNSVEVESKAETKEAHLDPENVIPKSQINGTVSTSSRSASSSKLSEEDKASLWRSEKTGKLIMYGTTQTHSIGTKAALILGLKFKALEVKARDGYALRGETLKKALEEDERDGNIPFMLIATLGTTSSGAVDDITEIAGIVKSHPTLWLHIDAAYAGVCLSIPELRASSHLDAINEAADSFSTNLHKWGLVQFDCSPLHVRDRGTLSRALTITPEYLRTRHGDSGSVLDLRNLQISLGRRFRSLKMWFVLRSYGLEGFRNHLKKGISLANNFEKLLRSSNDSFEIVAPPRWALVVFRLNPGTEKLGKFKDLDELNQKFWSNLQTRSDEIALTQTVLPEIGFCIRLVVGSPQTEPRHIEGAWEVIKEVGRITLKEAQAN